MIQILAPITSLENVTSNIWVISLRAPEIIPLINPGQFVNIKVGDLTVPLLRRPFSIYYHSENEIKILFNIVGRGTSIISEKKAGEKLDILGPLGNPFSIDGNYDVALLLGGGMGVAPLPLLASSINKSKKEVVVYLGAKNSAQLVTHYLKDVHIATDDGSKGYHGTVLDLLRVHLNERRYRKPKIFACGPTPMFNSLVNIANEFNIPCDVCLEGAMACGFGICQGCPVEMIGTNKKYSLVCKDGPIFDIKTLRMPLNG